MPPNMAVRRLGPRTPYSPSRQPQRCRHISTPEICCSSYWTLVPARPNPKAFAGDATSGQKWLPLPGYDAGRSSRPHA